MFSRPSITVEHSTRFRATWMLIAGLAISSGCAALHPIRGVPASHAPAEVLGESREGNKTINLSLLVRRPPDQYRVEAGDILAVYIPGLLGTRTVIGPALGAQVVGETPPITAPANPLDPPMMGFPITVRDDHTLVLPQLQPIFVYGKTIREVEQAIAQACEDARILQQQNAEILVSLWRPREYRVLVVRQEAVADTTGATSMLGTVNIGASKRGSGHVVRLRAYENDVLHALTDGLSASNGLPGLDAENAIYIIRRNTHRGACPAGQLPATPGGPTPAVMPSQVYSPAARPLPQAAPHYAPPAAAAPPSALPYAPAPVAAPPAQSPYALEAPSPQQSIEEERPLPSIAEPAPTDAPLERYQYGTPDNGLPILPQSYQVIRGQNPSGSAFAWSRQHSGRRSGNVLQGHTSSEPMSSRGSRETPAHQILQTSGTVPYAGGPGQGGVPMDSAYAGYGSADAGPLFPDQFGMGDFTIDSPSVIRIPVRLAPGQSPNITEEDITLYDGDIIFIESRDSEVFYTGGLLGGGEYMLPRDRDLRVTEAVSVAQARTTGGGTMASSGGVSALNGDVSVSPSRVIVRRRLADGRIIPIEIDLYRARLHPEEDILVQPHDLIMLQYTCGEATLAFIERHLLAGALFGVAASQLTTGR